MFDVEDREECVAERFLVVAVEPLLPGYHLGEFNEGYPNDLLRRHGLPISPLMLEREAKGASA